MSEQNGSETKWLTTGEVAQLLGVSRSSAIRLANEGALETKRRELLTRREEDSMGRKLRGRRQYSEASVLALKAELDRAGGREGGAASS